MLKIVKWLNAVYLLLGTNISLSGGIGGLVITNVFAKEINR